MNRSFYLWGIFFAGLCLIMALLQLIIYSQLGPLTYYLQSFAVWFVLGNIVAFIERLILLKYYQYKKYWLAFSAGIISTLASLFHVIVFYNMLTRGELGGLFATANAVILGTVILYAISLVFSNARERPSLKIAGIFTFIVGLLLMSTFIWSMHSKNTHLITVLGKIQYWASLAGNLTLVLFMINYRSELRLLKAEKSNKPRREALSDLIALTGMAAFVSTVIFGSQLVYEGLDKAGHINKVTENTKRLAEPFEARSYVSNSGDTLRYRLMKPIDYDPKKKYPLVVCLHHGGAHGNDNIIQIDGSGAAQLLSEYANRSRYPAFIFVPQCPVLQDWTAIESSIFEIIHSLESAYAVDTERIYVTGISGGGYGSWAFICDRPKMFAAAIPVCGRGDPSRAPNIINTPVWAFQGEQDRFLPAKFSREMIAAIRKAGGHPRYTEFPGEGHNIWYLVSQTPDLLDWLFTQKRE
jgi:predicted esterase